jgi:hypothetical protein
VIPKAEDHSVGEDTTLTREEYVRRVLTAYRSTPGTAGIARRPDRLLAVALTTIENAFILAAARRLARPLEAQPLPAIRSLAYFLPVIDEVLRLSVDPNYFRYLRQKVEAFAGSR